MADDIDFLRAMQGVRRLNKSSAPPATKKRPPNRTLRAEIQQRALRSETEFRDTPAPAAISHVGFADETGDLSVSYLQAGVQKKVLRDLKKGSRYPNREVLDLHGLTQAQAQREIDQAMLAFDYAGLARMLIIHGKGLGSSQGPVLKNFTIAYLKTLPQVRAYCSASLQDGGTGAVYVLVRGG